MTTEQAAKHTAEDIRHTTEDLYKAHLRAMTSHREQLEDARRNFRLPAAYRNAIVELEKPTYLTGTPVPGDSDSMKDYREASAILSTLLGSDNHLGGDRETKELVIYNLKHAREFMQALGIEPLQHPAAKFEPEDTVVSAQSVLAALSSKYPGNTEAKKKQQAAAIQALSTTIPEYSEAAARVHTHLAAASNALELYKVAVAAEFPVPKTTVKQAGAERVMGMQLFETVLQR